MFFLSKAMRGAAVFSGGGVMPSNSDGASTRRQLTIGSHTGAEAAALYHSLAITCNRCGVNVYDYFCDIIDRCAAWPPNTPIEKYRDLLPDRWNTSQK